MSKKVSVIVATYNQDKFIGRCLRSLLHQTMPRKDYEIIVINDASTDNTSFALDLFKDPVDSLIKIINNEKNKGLPGSLNRGIQLSQANYIVRVDSDDFVNTNFINFLYIYLEENKDIDAVSCDYLVLDDNEVVLERKNSLKDPIACGIMFRRAHLLNIGLYDEKFKCNEEKELRYRFLEKYKINRLEIPLYRYRRHDSNLTNNKKLMEIYDKELIYKHGKKQNKDIL